MEWAVVAQFLYICNKEKDEIGVRPRRSMSPFHACLLPVVQIVLALSSESFLLLYVPPGGRLRSFLFIRFFRFLCWEARPPSRKSSASFDPFAC